MNGNRILETILVVIAGAVLITGVTGNRSAAAAINEAELYRDALSSSGSAIVATNLEGVIERWDRNAEKIFGYSRSEAIGRNIHETDFIMPNDYCDTHLESMTERAQQTEPRKQIINMDCNAFRKDRSRVDILISTRKIKNGFIAVIDRSSNVHQVVFNQTR